MKKTILALTLIATSAIAAPSPVRAGDIYVMGGGMIELSTSSPELDSVGTDVFMGYRFNPYFALEVGYKKLKTETWAFKYEQSHTYIAPTGMFPLNKQWDLFGRVGIGSKKDSVTLFDGYTCGWLIPCNSEGTSSQLSLGTGIQYTSSFGLTARFSTEIAEGVGFAAYLGYTF
ncbi:exported hypothetical protein [Vibrio coralliirubri]|uniref:outer membrane beta-barrel protein n=1 Tax=Vibrio coralliirubri TaxID=1516159 RepID=UPI0006370752|nr:outer membrane beta-barrel protein [Vibrio coralliirubri]CDT53296.1 exported hypothetical protein [Vibrio coralliirubri]